MRRKLELSSLLFLLLLSIPYCFSADANSDLTNPPRNPSTPLILSNNTVNNYTLLWTSRLQTNPQSVENGSVISGDHVVVSSRWEVPVVSSRISIRNSTGENSSIFVDIDSEVESPSEVMFDTYGLLPNCVVDIILYGWNSTDVMTVEFCNITIQNYFEPTISDLITEEIESYVWNISWLSFDSNTNDTNYFSVWISGDSGVTYQLLAMNLSQSYWVWDSIGYSMLDYLVRIRAYSLDLTFGNRCSTSNPPHSYWPGDYSDATILLDAGTVHSWPPGYGSVSIDSPEDFTYIEGSSGNTIVWTPIPITRGWNYLVYDVFCNGTPWTSGEFDIYADETIEVNIDGLSPGFYIFEIHIGGTASDSVNVTVFPNNSQSLFSQIIHYSAMGVSIGSSLVILTVIVMTVKKRRDYYSQMIS